MRRFLLIISSIALLGAQGCNTVAGFGKDMSKVGDKIEKKAEQVQK
jgi:predicted small secreted protein